MKWILPLLCCFIHTAQADIDRMILEGVNSDQRPFSDGNSVGIEDYALEWVGTPIENVTFQFTAPVEWVRVLGRTAIPRARIFLSALEAQSASVSYGGKVTSLHSAPKGLSGSVWLLLLSDPAHTAEIQVLRGSRVLKGIFRVVHVPSAIGPTKVITDTTCNPPALDAFVNDVGKRNWMYVICQYEHGPDEHGVNTSLLLNIVWPNVGQRIEINGIPVDSQALSFWQVRVASTETHVVLKHATTTVDLKYKIPPHWYSAFIAFGVGPYLYKFDDGINPFSALYPVPTIYGVYRLSDSKRLALFDMTTIAKKSVSDFGFYYVFDSLHAMDNRFTMNLMLGAHGLGFGFKHLVYIQPDFAQGAEFLFSDFLMKNKNISIGAFLYPKINGQYYYNFWLRWGEAQWFLELNYIAWQRYTQEMLHNFEAVGFSVGVPIVSFL